MKIHIEDYVQQAIEQVEAWDLPADQFADAVNSQARLMAGVDLDYRDNDLETQLHTSLRF